MQSALCIFAHPDDEIFAGGILSHLATHGVALHLLCVTHGEHGAPGYPPLADRSILGAVRTQEMRCSAEVLGAASLMFLDYQDVVGAHGELVEFVHDAMTFQAQLMQVMRLSGADIVITHGSDGEYGHPAHKLVHRTVLAAARALADDSPLVYSFQAYFEHHPHQQNANSSDSAHLVLNTKRYLQSHVANMFRCHHTQSSWWLHTKSEALGRTATPEEAWFLSIYEGLHRHHPPVDTDEIEDVFVRWLAKHPL
jgi:N-acetylglucosamine malate deacetylase 2